MFSFLLYQIGTIKLI